MGEKHVACHIYSSELLMPNIISYPLSPFGFNPADQESFKSLALLIVTRSELNVKLLNIVHFVFFPGGFLLL